MFNYEQNHGSYNNARTGCSKCNNHQRHEVSEASECKANLNETRNNDCQYQYHLVGFPLASVYSPIQSFDNIYDCETALSRGTIFIELDLPFVCGGMNGGVARG